MNRVALVIAVVVSAALAWPASADTTIRSQDGTVELTVPNGWRESKPFSPAIKVQATSARGSLVFVRVASKEDFKDLKSFVDVGMGRLQKNMPDAEPKREDVLVNNQPAIRITMEGTQASGQRRGFLLTYFETDGTYVDVVGMANPSVFKVEQEVLAGMANRVKILAASGPGTPAASTQTPPPPTPPKPPQTRPPH